MSNKNNDSYTPTSKIKNEHTITLSFRYVNNILYTSQRNDFFIGSSIVIVSIMYVYMCTIRHNCDLFLKWLVFFTE